jgi:Uncharacterized conserved protein (DUF2203)
MSKQRNQEAEATPKVRWWTYAEAVQALPYLRSIVRSLRERWLESVQAHLQLRRMEARPGRPDRQALIVQAEVGREAERAQENLTETLKELAALGVYCLDPARGEALIPFRQGDDLAWYIFDLFAPQGLSGWRFHADPLEMRRPLVEKDPASPATVSALAVDRLMSEAGWQ